MANSISPLQILNFYLADDAHDQNRKNPLWHQINEMLSWDAILYGGYQTDIAPLIYYCSKNISDLFPARRSCSSTDPKDYQVLRDLYNRSIMRNFIFFNELESIVDILKEEDHEFISLKGIGLAETVYPNIACRPMGDIDILLRKTQIKHAVQLLKKAGFRVLNDESANYLFHLQMARRVTLGLSVPIEIHYTLFEEMYAVPFNSNLCWQNASDNYLDIHLEIVYIAWHAMRNGAVRMLSLIDILLLIKKYRDRIDWEKAFHIARRLGLSLQVSYVLYLIKKIFLFKPLTDGDFSFSERHKYFHCVDKLFLLVHRQLRMRRNPRYSKNILYIMLSENIFSAMKYLLYRNLKSRSMGLREFL